MPPFGVAILKICGIVAEYNPFHSGHKYHIEETRKLGATHIVCAMSSSFVQRGELSILNKWGRARTAIKNGADLVIELPVCYSLAAAETFSRASVYSIACLGACMLSFGSESGDINTLAKTAVAIRELADSDLLKEKLASGVSYPTALTYAIEQQYNSQVALPLTRANDTLGIEYINTINALDLKIAPVTIKRLDIAHDSAVAGETVASASFIRSALRTNNFASVAPYLPPEELATLISSMTNEKLLEPMLLYRLKTISVEELAEIPDVTEGLEHRIKKSATTATSLNEFYSLVKTKRYTLARIRRIAYLSLLKITKQSVPYLPQYVRVLALNERGKEILSACKKTSPIKAYTKFAQLEAAFPNLLQSEILATDLLNLTTHTPTKGGDDYLVSPILL